jgi:hypothetical protein
MTSKAPTVAKHHCPLLEISPSDRWTIFLYEISVLLWTDQTARTRALNAIHALR